jgi:hypothetical protein
MTIVFRCSRFAHHYSGNHIRFLFLALLRCFSSGRLLPYPIYSDRDIGHIYLTDGFPHSETPGSSLIWQLPEAFRSLQRLSSPLNAKASPICPFQLFKFVVTYWSKPWKHRQWQQWKIFFVYRTLFSNISKITNHLYFLVGPSWLEQPTSPLSAGCSNQLSYRPSVWESLNLPFENGRPRLTRTTDLPVISEALSPAEL